MADKQILDVEECHQVLKKFLHKENFQINSFKVMNFHNPLQGLLGDHLTLQITYIRKNKEYTGNFFVKTLSNNFFIMNISRDFLFYEKEEFYYNLLDEYQKYNVDVSFAPKGLFFKPFIIVLEDVSEKYKGTPKRYLLDLDHSLVGLETVAKFHASSIIYAKSKEKELGRKYFLNDDNSEILEDKFASKDEDSFGVKYITFAITGLFELIDLIPENHINHQEFKNKLIEILSKEESADGLISGLLHGDLWTSNFLYRYENNKPVEAKLVDFAMIKYGPLELDVALFLMTNTSRSLRDQHYENLIGHYYQKLEFFLISSGLNSEEILPSKSEFVRSCDNFKLAAKVHAIVDHSYTFSSDEIYGNALKSEESFKKFLFEDRGKYVIESYNTNEDFKNVLCEDALELRDLLFS